MSLIAALDDLRSDLFDGKNVDDAINDIAVEHDLKPVFLRNRAIAALGDLETYTDRAEAARIADRENLEAAKKKIALTRIVAQIDAHNSNEKRVTDDQLALLVAAANSLGANYQVVQRGSRNMDPGAVFDRTMNRLIRELMKTAGL